MALTKTTKPSIIKTRAQSRTAARTGPNVRTNDDTIAPAPARRTIDSVNPVAAVTTGRTTDVAPAPVDLFAGRPTTGALKDPPPVLPRDSNDAKKPAAKPTKPKPKGRPKKVVAPHQRRQPYV